MKGRLSTWSIPRRLLSRRIWRHCYSSANATFHGSRAFRDPLVANPYRTSRRAALLDRIVESAIFHRADVLLVNTAEWAERCRRTYPHLGHKIHLIWNGFDPEDGLHPLPPSSRPTRVIAHVGSCYGDRTPMPLLGSLRRLSARGELTPKQIQLQLLGPIQNTWAADHEAEIQALIQAGSLMIDNRMASRAEAQTTMLQADYLLLLDMMSNRNSELTVPAKIFEYVRACRPILAFARPRSATARLLAQSGIPHTCIDPSRPCVDIDASVLAFFQGEPAETAPTQSFLRDFDARRQTYALPRIISQLRVPAPGR